MTSYVQHWAWYAKTLFQNIPLIPFNNFNHDQLAVKTKLKCLKRQLSNQIIEKWSSGVSKWHHMSDNGMVCKSSFSKYSPYPIPQLQLVVKTNSKGLKRQLSSQIIEKWLNDVICPTLGMVCKNFFFKIFLLSYRTTSTMINLSWKASLRA